MPPRERISGVDTAWLRMDHPTNLMMIVGVMMFDGKIGVPDLKRLLRSRWMGFRRFRQKAVEDATGAWWVEDEAFDMAWHVREVDGHDLRDLLAAFESARQEADRQTLLVAHTVKGKGVSFMEDTHAWHGKAPSKDELERAIAELGATA